MSESCLNCIKQKECNIKNAYYEFRERVHKGIGDSYKTTKDAMFEVDTSFGCCEYDRK